MPNSMSLELQQRPSQNIKQLQRLIMSRQMQQAIHLLQVPVMELTPLVDLEMEQNPVLEYAEEGECDIDQDQDEQERLGEDVEESSENEEVVPETQLDFKDNDFEVLRRLDEDFRDHFLESGGAITKRSSEENEFQAFIEASVTTKETLFEHLMEQAQLTFHGVKERTLAEFLIGHIDERGFLTTPLQELALVHHATLEEVDTVLKTIQTFHPVGVGARDLRESLLIQLRFQKKDKSLAYDIVENYFDDLLHNRIGVIRNKLHCTAEQIGKVIDRDIAKLDLHPGAQLSNQTVPYIVPDVTLRQEGDNLVVTINDESVPSLRLNTRYLRMLNDETLPKETKEFIHQKILSARWLIHNIMQRNSTIEKIADNLAKRQRSFFLDPQGKLTPLTMKIVADELDIHESTVARAVSNKYIDTPRGILPLRSFFTNAITTDFEGELSSRTVRDILKEIIGSEDKRHPLSDEALAIHMKDRGIKCARRTIAKYRVIMKIGTAQQRRKY
ncbi:MAG: RNA polymerase factor sigma-54 [Parachlamydiaceae bacterium]